MSCKFCRKADFGSFSARVEGAYATISLAGGSSRYPSDDQFNYCPVCGRALKESAQYIPDQTAEIERLRALTTWIPCSERMPEKNVPCLAWNGTEVFRASRGEWQWMNDEIDSYEYEEPITHWMPLPEGPEEATP